MTWLGGIINTMNMSLSKLQEIVKDREARRAAVYEVTKSWTQHQPRKPRNQLWSHQQQHTNSQVAGAQNLPLRTSPKVAKMKSHGLLVLEIWGAGSRGGQDGLQSREMGELVVIILSTQRATKNIYIYINVLTYQPTQEVWDKKRAVSINKRAETTFLLGVFHHLIP